jgi:hypothetical protein
VYVDMHGRPENPYWLYAGGKRAIHVNELGLETNGKIVFATTCHLPETKFYDNIVNSGNTLVSGAGSNWGGVDRAIGAALLALWFRKMLEAGFSVRKALFLAKARVALTSLRRADRDALKFSVQGGK